jgi:hypothetical protein
LKAMGHTITSRWIKPDTDHLVPIGLSAQAADAERERFAREDLEDVIACDAMVSLMEEPRTNSRGGRHVEFGMGLALGKKMFIIGPRETVFHHLRGVRHFDSVERFLADVTIMANGLTEAETAATPSVAGLTLEMSHIDRVRIEEREMAERLGELMAFKGKMGFALLPAAERQRLIDQAFHMANYLGVLRARIEAFGKEY